MKFAILILALIGYATAIPINDTELLNKIDWSKIRSEDVFVDIDGAVFYGPGGRIVGGNEATRNSVPHQAAVINDRNGFCGGSLISNNVVLTAAHCTINSNAATVILGAHEVNSNEATQQARAGSRIVNHPSYNTPTSLANDVALVFLDQAVTLNNNVAVIALAPANSGTFAGVTATVTGWGRPSDSATGISPHLRTVQVPVVTNSVCSLTYGSIINDGIICTSGQNGRGSCNGDSGGPLITGAQLIGVVSFGSSAGCESGAPNGFARVPFYREWIRATCGV